MPFKDPEQRKAYDRKRSQDPKRRERTIKWQRENRERHAETIKRWKKAHPDKIREYQNKYNAEHKQKQDARVFTRLAVKFGYIEKTACFCGEEAQIHHPNYSDPINIEWLCRKHHLEAHSGNFKTGGIK